MINSPSSAISLQHFSGLFRVFEEYQKVLEEKKAMEVLLKDLWQDWITAEEQWARSELCYEAEICRLDLLIAKGVGGMSR